MDASIFQASINNTFTFCFEWLRKTGPKMDSKPNNLKALFTVRKKITRFFHCLLFTCVPFCCKKTHKNKVKKVKRKKTIDAKVNLNWDGKINPIASHMSLDNIPIFVWQSSLQHHFSIFTHIWYTIVRMSHVQLTSNAEKRKNLVYVRDLYAFEGLAFFYSFLLFFPQCFLSTFMPNELK